MNRDRLLDRRTYLKTTGAIVTAGSVGVAGCVGDDTADDATGTLATRVTDQPGDIGDFESCVVTIRGLWVKPAAEDEDEDGEDEDEDEDENENENENEDDESENDEDDESEESTEGGETETPDRSDAREYHEFDEPQEADLVQLQDGETQLADEREFAAGEYEFVQLDVTGVEATLSEGGDADVSTPGNAPLQFKHRFEIRDGQRTVFTADFTPVRRGATGSYLLQPVARGTSVEYEDVDETDDGNETDDGDATDDADADEPTETEAE